MLVLAREEIRLWRRWGKLLVWEAEDMVLGE
jgi:hypothetical protein